jgi:transposase
MRGPDERTGELFSNVDLEQRVPENHPLRVIRHIFDGEFATLYAAEGRPSILPEWLLRAFVAGVLQHSVGASIDGTAGL